MQVLRASLDCGQRLGLVPPRIDDADIDGGLRKRLGISSGQSAAIDKRGKKVAIALKHVCAEIVDTASQRVLAFPSCTVMSLAESSTASYSRTTPSS